ncbi:Lateral signaling target protein 2 [Phytophthora nicotianae]|uniref:Lateral signaling target protein 2 n=1 Tax=Phytophthora nicotianae TaxID=4792 RepID=A0A0W8D6P3_PHYNI|nr:Lateral signaling target protein 2 [Phytophthora nicotianae]
MNIKINDIEDRTGNVTPRASPGKLASLLSIIKQKKEEKDHASDQHGRPPYDDRERHQRADSGAYSHHSYDERRGNDQRPDRRDVGGIMGDAPGIPVGSRMRRDPDDRPGALNDRDPKKARGSRWGPSNFAHGEEELDKSARYPPRPPAHGDQSGGRWQPSPSQGMEQPRVSPSANAPPSSQARSYGAPQVYNEPHGDRGSRGGDSSVSYANAAAPSPNGRRLLPDHQTVSGPPPQVYQGTYASAPSPYGAGGGSTYAPPGQDRSHVPGNVPVLPSPASQSYGDRAAVPTGSTKVLADDDEGDTAEPEFTLEYDDED